MELPRARLSEIKRRRLNRDASRATEQSPPEGAPCDDPDLHSPSALMTMAAFGIDLETLLTAKANEGLEDLTPYHHMSPTGTAAAALYAAGLFDQDEDPEPPSGDR